MLRRREAELPLDAKEEPAAKDITLVKEIGMVVGNFDKVKYGLLGGAFLVFLIILCLFEKSYLHLDKPFWLQYAYYCSWSLLTLGLVIFPLIAFFHGIEKNKMFRSWIGIVILLTLGIELVSNSIATSRAQEIVEFATADVLVAIIMVWATPLLARAIFTKEGQDNDQSFMQYLGHVAPFAQVIVGVVKFTSPSLEDTLQIVIIVILILLGIAIAFLDKKKSPPIRGSFGYCMVLIIGQLIVDAVGSVFLESVRYELSAFKLMVLLLVFEITCAVFRTLATGLAKGAFEDDASVAGFTFLPDICESLFTLFIAANVVRSWGEVFVVIIVMTIHAFALDAAAVSALRHFIGVGSKKSALSQASMMAPLESMHLSYLSSLHRFIACVISSIVALLAILAHAVTPGNLCAIGCSRALSSGPFFVLAIAKVLIALGALYVQRKQLVAASGGLLRVISDAKGHVTRWLPVFVVSSAFACIHGLHFAVLARNRL